jgi:hypothetical protein
MPSAHSSRVDRVAINNTGDYTVTVAEDELQLWKLDSAKMTAVVRIEVGGHRGYPLVDTVYAISDRFVFINGDELFIIDPKTLANDSKSSKLGTYRVVHFDESCGFKCSSP